MSSIFRREHKRTFTDIALETVASTRIDFGSIDEGINIFQERINSGRPEIKTAALESLKKYLNTASDVRAILSRADDLVDILMGVFVKSQSEEERELIVLNLASLRLALAGQSISSLDLVLESCTETLKKTKAPDASSVYLTGFLAAFADKESTEKMLALEALLQFFEGNTKAVKAASEEQLSGLLDSIILCLSGFQEIEVIEEYRERLSEVIERFLSTSDFHLARSVVNLFITLYSILNALDDKNHLQGGARSSNQFFYYFNDRILAIPNNLRKKSEKTELSNIIGDMDESPSEMILTFKSQKVTIPTKSGQNLIRSIRDLVQVNFDILMSSNSNVSEFFGFTLRNEKEVLRDIRRNKDDTQRVRSEEKVVKDKELSKKRAKKLREVYGEDDL